LGIDILPARTGTHDNGTNALGVESRPSRRERPAHRRRPGVPGVDGAALPDVGILKTVSRLLAYFRPYRWRALRAFLVMGLVSLSTVLMLFLLTKVIDDVLGPGASDSMARLSKVSGPEDVAPFVRWLDLFTRLAVSELQRLGLSTRLAIPFLLFLALSSKNLFSYLSEASFNGIGLGMVRDLRRDAYWRLLGQSARFYSRASTGDLMSRLLSDVEHVQSAFGTRLADLVQGILSLALVLVYVFSLDAHLTLVVLLLGPAFLVPVALITRRLQRVTYSSRERIGEIGAILAETLRGQRVIKTYGMETFEAKRFGRANDRYYDTSRRAVRTLALGSPAMEIVGGLGLSALIVYAAAQIAASRMTVGGLISFLAALMMMYKPIKDITRTNLAIQLAVSSAKRIFELMDQVNEIVEKPDAAETPDFSERIRYEGVSFHYGEAPVLQGIDLAIRRGETVAIVGPSGAGKTTLVNLLPRLYDPTAGRVTFDGMDLRDVTLSSLRRQIALVTQETVLFDASAQENIAYGDPDADPARVRAAARAAYAEEFLDQLPEGFQTRLGEDAARLSGGQRQRIAIARAIYRDAPVLILDEATSQLDTESDALIARALSNLMRGRTTLVIAHRLSTVRRADRIVVLERGRIVESGSHLELIAREGLYKRLNDAQYFETDDAATVPAASG